MVTSSTRDLWHCAPSGGAFYHRCVTSRADERLAAGVGLVVVLAVGVAQVVTGSSAALAIAPGRLAAWWVAYAAYLLIFLIDAELLLPAAPWSSRVNLAVQTVAGVTVWLVAPELDWTAVLFVVTGVSAAFTVSLRGVVGVVAVQAVATAVGSAMAGKNTFAVVFTTVLYACFQVFAALVVRMALRESRAKAELAAANAELGAATALLASSSRAAERLRIARDLHDVLGHQLTALALELEIASHRVDGPAAEHVARARALAKDLLADVREVVSELRDAPQGLEPALRRMVSGLPGLAVDLEVSETRLLDETRSMAVVRFVQEVVTNTLRHASASRLTVRVVSDDDGLRLEARDDGVGAARWQAGHGLTGMRERFAQLGGEVELDPGPGRGFAVAVRVPAR